MLYIKKKRAPHQYIRAVARIRSSPAWKAIVGGDTKAIRSQFDLLPKEDIRESLLVEQHFLCAYCMKRIRNDALHMAIEHWTPLSYDKERALDYQNFLGVCKGGADLGVSESGKRVLCCDASKGSYPRSARRYSAWNPSISCAATVQSAVVPEVIKNRTGIPCGERPKFCVTAQSSANRVEI